MRTLTVLALLAAAIPAFGQLSSTPFSVTANALNSTEASGATFAGRIDFNAATGTLSFFVDNQSTGALTGFGFRLGDASINAGFAGVAPWDAGNGLVDTQLTFNADSLTPNNGNEPVSGTYPFAASAPPQGGPAKNGLASGSGARFDFTLTGFAPDAKVKDLFQPNPADKADLYFRVRGLEPDDGSDKIGYIVPGGSPQTTPVPEPGVYGLLGALVLGGVVLRRRYAGRV
jgi:hypothetical protein